MDEENLTQTATPQPSFELHSPAVDFIENRLHQYHPAFDARHVRFSPSQGQYVPRRPLPSDLSLPQNIMTATMAASDLLSLPQQSQRPAPSAVNDMLFWHEIFPKAMEMLKLDTSSCEIKDPAWKIRHLSTWADVQAILARAQQQYDFYSGPQQVGRFRRKMRSVLDDNTAKLQQVARLVPEVDIAKPVVGAIKVVLDAYRQVSEVREEVATSFDELPEAFENIEFYLQTYHGDDNIASASCHLICAILDAVEHAIVFYTSHQAKRAGMAILSGPEYQKNLVQSLQKIKSRCNSLESQASKSLAYRVASDNSRMMEQQALMQHVLGSIHKGVQIHNMEMNLGMSFFAALFNEVYPLLNGQERARRSPSPMGIGPFSLPQLIKEEIFWSPQDIWACLCIPAIDEEDLRYVTENAELMLHRDGGRAQQLLGESPFRKWMSVSSSARLLVHGDFQPPFDISPLSVVCTLLTHTFRNLGSNFVSLVFFCGRHQIWDVHRGGSAIIRSLIDQLLRQCAFGPIRPETNMSLEDLDRDDIRALCEVFISLFRQLSSHMQVFCLIDGICLYEADQYLDGMDIVIMSLISLVESGGYGMWPTFKLLITSPSPTVEVRKVFDPEPDTLLSIQGPSLVNGGMGLAGLQEQFNFGIHRTE
ncbi:uncharacterized protein LY79DRAFT_662919 [Colletotrichum navitas]|uniref:DUF7708 domain-containing protein n=1 Tax=Colletotrichum navitas TaxID=681940 RepID=A0AAD8PNA2_9PEZI|nr:uncharacterized protein LY79DRAFT_662919 [Colletotrichum navitas]KAK1573262.1 hypothetical protein LY79DRAFT_662919 [Colletotrichum navitas]